MWVRPNSLLEDGVADTVQVFGHTRGSEVRVYSEQAICIDALESGNQYLVIEDSQIEVKQV